MRQDVNLCREIMDIDAFAELSATEKQNSKGLSQEQRSWLARIEKAAGILG